MDQRQFNDFHQINLMTMMIGSLYHESSVRLGITDNIALILHFLYDNGESCQLSDFYKKTGVPKQTVNSSLRKLEASGILYLEQHDGRSKRVVLTEKGKQFMHETIGQLREAEIHALDGWTPEEVRTYILLITKVAASLQREFSKLKRPNMDV